MGNAIPVKPIYVGDTVVKLGEFQTGDVIPSEYIPFRENLIINGDFSIAQRGTSFTSTTWCKNNDDSYLLDRWLLLSDGNDIVDVSQVSGAFSRSRYALQAEVETANKRFGFCQIIEANSCIPLRGQKISVSFAAKTVSAKLVENIRVAVLEWTGTADTVTSDVVSAWNAEGSNPTWATNWAALNTPANLALTTSAQTFKLENLTVGASCNNLAVFVWVDDTDAAVDDILQLGEVQAVRGSVAPEFVARYIVSELNACQRRFVKCDNLSGTYSALMYGHIVNETSALYYQYINMAGVPTALFTHAASGYLSDVLSLTSIGIRTASTSNKLVVLQTGFTSGGVAGRASQLQSNNNTAFIAFEAEL